MWILIVLMLVLVALPLIQQWTSYPIKRWRRTLQLDKHEAAYMSLFDDVNGFIASREARKASGDAPEYVYGEIDFISFIALLSLTKPNQNTVFYDLGSGIGKAVIAAAMVFNMKKNYGIERFKALHDVANHQRYKIQAHPYYKERFHKIKFINDDFLNLDFADATLIFINATALFGETWLRLSSLLENTAPKTTIITTSKALKSPVFTITHTTTVAMSWGQVRA